MAGYNSFVVTYGMCDLYVVGYATKASSRIPLLTEIAYVWVNCGRQNIAYSEEYN